MQPDGRSPKPVRRAQPSRKLLEKRARRAAKASRHLRHQKLPALVYGSIGAVLFAAFIGFIVYVNNSPRERQIKPSIGSAELVGQRVPIQPTSHLVPPQKAHYDTDPPSSGPHYTVRGQAPTPWDAYYDRSVPPEYWLHNLEHAGIVITYNCAAGCAADQSKIRDFISGAPKEAQFGEVKIVAIPYQVPGHRFALLAWGWRETLDSWDSRAAERFYEAHVDRGPELVR